MIDFYSVELVAIFVRRNNYSFKLCVDGFSAFCANSLWIEGKLDIVSGRGCVADVP